MNKLYVRQWQVPSSKAGKSYIVSLSRTGEWSCSCVGWTSHTPRKACKHIREAKATGDKYLLWADAVKGGQVPAPEQKQKSLHFGVKRAITFDD